MSVGMIYALHSTMSLARPRRPASLDHDALSRLSRPSRDHPLSSPPTVSSFHIPASATHAGGILPSASFFHPSRPPAHSPPTSPRPQPSHDSDLRPTSVSPSLARLIKRSREPLLPLSLPADPPPKLDTRFCARLTRKWHNPSIDSSHDVIPLSITRSGHDTPLPPRQSLVQIPSSSPSPNNMFIPDPPTTSPPLSAVPITPRKRIYQLYPSRNRFFCSGRLLTGGDVPWAFIASLAVVIAISAAWFSTTCVWWWHNQSPAVACVGAYMCLLTISCMLATVSALRLSSTDHPRNFHRLFAILAFYHAI